MGTQQFCLKWNNHSSNMLTIFEQLLSSEALVDVTLACDGLSLKAHKMVLSACSPFFHSLFLENPCKHPVVILKDIKYNDLKAVIDFMYRGEVNVSQDRLSALLQTAETLKIKGLAEVGNQQTQGSSDVIQQEITQQPNSSIDIPRDKKLELPVFRKRKRGRPRRCSLSDSNRSDTEEPLASKVKIADSLEVSNSITKDDSDSSIEIQPIANVSNHSQSQISIHSISLCTNSEDKNLENMKTAIQVSNVTTEDGPSDDETEFEMEPSRLMEQTLTTDNITTFSDGQSQDSCLPSISAQPSMTSTAECIEPSLQNCDTNSNGQALVPCSLPPETFTSVQSSRDDSQDIKPRALLSFEEPKISLPAGSSHYDDNALMMYMDTSGVPAVPGPSNFQLDKQSQILHHSQGFLERNISHHSTRYPKGVYACAFCNKRFSSKYYLRQHIQLHTPFRKKYRCNQCGKEFNWNQDLLRHGRNVHGNPSQGRKMTAVV